ncbi:hypothetical protein DPMN_013709 [Dreissena polymorpha]|uniref:Uncharacterized protein n=1 Tax=Dreissena polymorpha TaxID=45954 RepID=A0A9D4S222_DREPO|nr:hypothetical protein DPMN_013709 [Dreissena polymorpha]
MAATTPPAGIPTPPPAIYGTPPAGIPTPPPAIYGTPAAGISTPPPAIYGTPPAGISTPPPAIYGTPAAEGPVMPPHLQYLTQQTPTQYGYMNAPVSPQNGNQTHNTSQMDSEMYTTILNKLNNIECTQNKCNQNFQN